MHGLEGPERVRREPVSLRIFTIMPLFIESKSFLKSMKQMTSARLFFFTSSMILLKARIWVKLDLPFLKPFWLDKKIAFLFSLGKCIHSG